MIELTCLSIRQPWCWAIFNAGKDIENRSWRSNYRGKLLIHASKNFDFEGYKYLEQNKSELGIEKLPSIEELKAITGGFVGMVDMVSCRKNLKNNVWEQDDCYGWVFKDAVKLNYVPFKGKLSLFNVEINNALKHRLDLNTGKINGTEHDNTYRGFEYVMLAP